MIVFTPPGKCAGNLSLSTGPIWLEEPTSCQALGGVLEGKAESGETRGRTLCWMSFCETIRIPGNAVLPSAPGTCTFETKLGSAIFNMQAGTCITLAGHIVRTTTYTVTSYVNCRFDLCRASRDNILQYTFRPMNNESCAGLSPDHVNLMPEVRLATVPGTCDVMGGSDAGVIFYNKINCLFDWCQISEGSDAEINLDKAYMLRKFGDRRCATPRNRIYLRYSNGADAAGECRSLGGLYIQGVNISQCVLYLCKEDDLNKKDTRRFVFSEIDGCPPNTYFSRASIWASSAECRSLRGVPETENSAQLVLCTVDICQAVLYNGRQFVPLPANSCPETSLRARAALGTEASRCRSLGGESEGTVKDTSLRICSLKICPWIPFDLIFCRHSHNTSASNPAGKLSCLPCDANGEFYEDPALCSRYYVCDGNRIQDVAMPCAPGTAWNQTTKTCDHLRNVRC
ncbi:uncharacterized protein LOC106164529 [Lingula anatina]|uniref:Uncharacterized protein LOC106164529 n=1 Tax=Lingula anatina TaxID=7574 RepID=A0A1S3II88_LINAN|nr:uncharacterized protein LOC106164529 [Lingula anatina]|eukprot:XP_013397927.1 uncharacterized protein LOC106164529 [Lingula anatina]